MKNKVIAIAGPTASGKTSMAIELALKIGGEIVSADSRLVYRGFNIAAAKPSKEEMCGIPHYLIDITEPETDYSAGKYYFDAKAVIDDIISRGKIPIVAGGTGLYFRVLLENYNLPKVDTNYALRNELDSLEKNVLLEKLKKSDAYTYDRLKCSNKRRIVRALELITTLGKPLSEVKMEKDPEYEVEWLMPEIPSRVWLYERINKRVDLMIEKGIVEETKQLINAHGRIQNIVCTIGYKEMLEYIDGISNLETAAEKLKQHSRNYAKRQITWFRKNPAYRDMLMHV